MSMDVNSCKDITPPSQFCLSVNIGLPLNFWVTLSRSKPESDVSARTRVNGGWERQPRACTCGEENQTAHHIIYHCEALRLRTKLPQRLGVSRPRGCLLVGPTCRDRLRVAAHTKEDVFLWPPNPQAVSRRVVCNTFKSVVTDVIFLLSLASWDFVPCMSQC